MTDYSSECGQRWWPLGWRGGAILQNVDSRLDRRIQRGDGGCGVCLCRRQ